MLYSCKRKTKLDILLLVENPNGLAMASNLSILNATRTKVDPYVTRHWKKENCIIDKFILTVNKWIEHGN